MSKSICVVLEKFTSQLTKEALENKPNRLPKSIDYLPCSLELKLSFDGDNYFLEEAWLDETIDFYAIADKYNFLDKLLEEALAQKLLDEKKISPCFC